MLTALKTSAQSPVISDNSAMPSANPPADNVPSPRLHPLLKVAPTQRREDHRSGIEFFKMFKFDLLSLMHLPILNSKITTIVRMAQR